MTERLKEEEKEEKEETPKETEEGDGRGKGASLFMKHDVYIAAYVFFFYGTIRLLKLCTFK